MFDGNETQAILNLKAENEDRRNNLSGKLGMVKLSYKGINDQLNDENVAVRCVSAKLFDYLCSLQQDNVLASII